MAANEAAALAAMPVLVRHPLDPVGKPLGAVDFRKAADAHPHVKLEATD